MIKKKKKIREKKKLTPRISRTSTYIYTYIRACMHTRRTRVPSVHGTMICCQWVKLFNPAGINHSRHVRNLCTGAAPECATLRGRTRNIRARPPGRPRRSLPPVTTNSLRYVTLGWPIAKKTRAISPPSSRCRELNPRDLQNSTRSYFSSFLFFCCFFVVFFFMDGQ